MRPLGTSGVFVSALGFGAGHIGADGHDERQVSALLDSAVELGVTFIDTARGYGASEGRIGRWLVTHRDAVVVSTKVGYGVPGVEDWTREAVIGGVERALRVLRCTSLDVVFLHSCPLDILERGDVVDALLACRDAGKIRVAGYSGENAELEWAAGSGAFGALQTSVNLADQYSVRTVLPRASATGLGVVAKRPLANAPWRYRTRPVGEYCETYWERLFEMRVDPVADDWAGTALRFSAFSAGVSTAIVGTASAAHLAEAAAAVARGPLAPDERSRWEEAFAPHADQWPGEV
jgi:aryl-alcohol dehydrogenase-like predicted oxidoreductase